MEKRPKRSGALSAKARENRAQAEMLANMRTAPRAAAGTSSDKERHRHSKTTTAAAGTNNKKDNHQEEDVHPSCSPHDSDTSTAEEFSKDSGGEVKEITMAATMAVKTAVMITVTTKVMTAVTTMLVATMFIPGVQRRSSPMKSSLGSNCMQNLQKHKKRGRILNPSSPS